jgi:hypothetical protein
MNIVSPRHEQILGWKPGNNTGEIKYGCTAGTMTTWMSQIDWAALEKK